MVLMFQKMSDDCRTMINGQYPAIYRHWYACVWANAVYGPLYIFHELLWSQCSLVDYTVVPDVAPLEKAPAAFKSSSGGSSGAPPMPMATEQTSLYPEVHEEEYMKEYKKIQAEQTAGSSALDASFINSPTHSSSPTK